MREPNMEAVNGALSREIQKLQAELKAADKVNADLIISLRAEVERLKDANAQLQEIVNGDTADEERIRAENATLTARVAELEKALEEAIDSEGGVAYDGDEDEVGYRVCCKESSYKPHDASCWVTKARAALTPQQGEK